MDEIKKEAAEYNLSQMIIDSIDAARKELINNNDRMAFIHLEKSMDFIKVGLHLGNSPWDLRK